MDWRRIAGLFLLIAGMAAAAAAADKAPLADAVEAKNKGLARTLLDGGADVNAAQVDGMTALHWAVYHDDAETAAQLVRKGANVNAANRYGVPPLSLASTNGNAELVKLLLEAGANANASLQGGETVLMTASRAGSVEAVKALLAHGANPNARERLDQTALMWAAAEGHAPIVRALIDAKADVNATLHSGFTPFFFAVREGHIDVVKTLLAAGVDVNKTLQRQEGDPQPGAPAPFRGPVAKGTSGLAMAVLNGHFDLGLALVDAGADPNDRRTGFTPLHMVTWVRKPDASDTGDPAPIGSGRLTSLQFVRALVERGANVNARLDKGTPRPPGSQSRLGVTGATPFLMATDRADILLMRLLLELGADPSLPNADGSTPLMAAAGLGTAAPDEEAGGSETEAMEAVQLLLTLGADVNAVDTNGDTAMHGAAYGSFPKIVKLLADRGARSEIWKRPNAAGSTPLFIAEGYRYGRPIVSRPTIDAILVLMKAENLPTDGVRPVFKDIYEKAPEPAAKKP
jgi:ankyrin repeat protein